MAGVAAASFLVPGVGPVLAFGLIGAALFGGGGAVAGALAGEALEEGIARGLPHDELYVYEDALRRGRTVVVALADDDESAGRPHRADARRRGKNGGSVCATLSGGSGDFKKDEAVYRPGFEAALHPDRRGQTYEQAATKLQKKYGAASARRASGRGMNADDGTVAT